jgi:hypothetical protein
MAGDADPDHVTGARGLGQAEDPERIAIREALAFSKAVYDQCRALGLSTAELAGGRSIQYPICPAVRSSDDRYHSVPNWSLWRWAARALGQVLACLAHRHARPDGGGADIGDRREQGVLPEVVGLPPGDLIKQVRFGPAV